MATPKNVTAGTPKKVPPLKKLNISGTSKNGNTSISTTPRLGVVKPVKPITTTPNMTTNMQNIDTTLNTAKNKVQTATTKVKSRLSNMQNKMKKGI